MKDIIISRQEKNNDPNVPEYNLQGPEGEEGAQFRTLSALLSEIVRKSSQGEQVTLLVPVFEGSTEDLENHPNAVGLIGLLRSADDLRRAVRPED